MSGSLAEQSAEEAEPRLQYLASSTRSCLQERNRLAHELAASTEADESAFHRTLPPFGRDKMILKQLHTLADVLDAWDSKNPHGDALQKWSDTVREMLELLQEPNQEINDPRGCAMLRELYERHPRLRQGYPARAGTEGAPLAAPVARRASPAASDELVGHVDEPYTDNPQSGSVDHREAAAHLAQQQLAFDQQDVQLDNLGMSISRQHELSLRMNEELEMHAGLLNGLDSDVENTGLRLGGAQRQLTRLERSVREHSAYEAAAVWD